MICAAFGREPSLEKARRLCSSDRSGTSLLGLLRASETLGLEARAMKGGGDSLQPSLPLPCLVLTRVEGRGHWLLIEKIRAKKILVVDPACGRARVSRKDFIESWTGYAVFFERGAGFGEEARGGGSVARFLPFASDSLPLFIRIFLASFALFFLNLSGFVYFRLLIDEVLPSGLDSTLKVLSLGMALATVFRCLLEAARSQILTFIGFKIDLSITSSYYRHVLSLPLSFFESRKVGEIVARMDDISRIRYAFSSAALSVALDLLALGGVGAFLFSQSPELLIVSLVSAPLSVLAVIASSPWFRRACLKCMSESAGAQARFVEAFTGIATLKSMNAQGKALLSAEEDLAAASLAGFRLERAENLQSVLLSLLESAGNIALLWTGSSLILKGKMSLGQLISFSALQGYFTGPLKRLLCLQPSLQGARVAAKRLGEILDLPREDERPGGKARPPSLRERIEFDKVAFRYASRERVLENLSFSVGKGERVAIVGPSGSGKSTLIKLLLKLYEPERGSISIGGIDIRDIDTEYLRSRVGYVPQEVFLFSGTVFENIALREGEADLEGVIGAAKAAGAHRFVSALPDRYFNLVGERGSTLSGGERQRIALARALLGSPDILVLDEATSALDGISESGIRETLESVSAKGISALVIAHRLSTVRSCHRILVLSGGTIIEEGSHEFLVSRSGCYAELLSGGEGAA
jgi:HlyB family type I secretion system ABC transporter